MKSQKQLKLGGLIGEDGLTDDQESALYSLGSAGAGQLANLVRGDEDNRSDQVARGAGAGALEYGAKGAELGSKFGPLGALIAGGAGAIGGAVLGGVQAKNKRDDFYEASISSYAAGGDLNAFHIMPDGTKMAGKTHSYAEGGDLNDLKGDPSEVTEYNGLRHEQGGIAIGSKEVEDGEVRVG